MKLKNYILSIVCACCATACSLLGPIDDLKPDYVLDDETLITDASSAEVAVRGIYASWRRYSGIYNAMFIRTGVLANSNVNGANKFKNGDIRDDNFTVSETYTALYYVVNEANSVLAALQRPGITGLDETARQHYMGEAKFNRALAHFMLLRLFGEFWNLDSNYGIVLYEEPVRDNKPKARSGVKDCYRLIIDDLEAASSIPVKQSMGSPVMYMANAISAKALLAKVQLSKGDYDKAYTLALQTINEAKGAGIQLEEDYGQIFSSFQNTELLFYPYTMNSLQKIPNNWFDWQQGAGQSLKKVAQQYPADKRYPWAFANPVNPLYKFNKYQMDDQTDNVPGNSLYLLRLGEVYFIGAEAALRKANREPEEAREILKVVLKRAGFGEEYLNGIPDDQLLKEVFYQKYLELFGENFEDWFDMVRYHQLDKTDWKTDFSGFQGQLILPIPRAALSGNHLLEQNPNLPI